MVEVTQFVDFNIMTGRDITSVFFSSFAVRSGDGNGIEVTLPSIWGIRRLDEDT